MRGNVLNRTPASQLVGENYWTIRATVVAPTLHCAAVAVVVVGEDAVSCKERGGFAHRLIKYLYRRSQYIGQNICYCIKIVQKRATITRCDPRS